MIDKIIQGFVVRQRNRPIECVVELEYKEYSIRLHSAYKAKVGMKGTGMVTFMQIYHYPTGTYCFAECETFQEAIEAIDGKVE